MKQRQHGMVVVGVLMLLAACANGGDATLTDGGGDGAKPKLDGGNPNQDSGGNTCVSSCSSDTDCQNSCTVPSMAIACCDLTVNTCYTTNNNTCPSPPDGGQTD